MTMTMAIHVKVLGAVLLAIAFGVAFSENDKELRTEEVTNQDKVIQLRHPTQYRSIDPSKVMQLSWQPRVFLYRDFLTNEECDYLISRGKDSPNRDTSSIPANSSVFLNRDDEFIKQLEERISAWTFLPKENSISIRVVHIGSEDLNGHYRYFGDDDAEQADKPLLATVILYLSDVSQGGQIMFRYTSNKMLSDCTKSNDTLTLHRGNAIAFFNLHLNASRDPTSSHSRCPVIQGNMWCAVKLFYLKSVAQEKGLKQAESECSDEDDKCSQWAGMGECARNPVFMIGSPDYYGTCRKSCNACLK